jgi:RNA polymerase sigma-70 factor (ECF subfamily)
MDSDLLICLKEDYETGFVELVELYKGYVAYIAWRMMRTQADAEDAVSETFCRLYRDLHGRESSLRSLKYFIRGVTCNVCLEELRKQRMERSQAPAVRNSHYSTRPARQKISSEDLSVQLDKCLDRLAIDARSIITKKYMERLTLQQIADELHISAQAVFYRVRSSLKNLRNCFEYYGVMLEDMEY